MARYLLTIEYDGEDFCGWQRQDNAISVQQTLEEAFFKLCHQKVTLEASGRTDAGVHAISQAAHVDLTTTIPAEKIPYAINTYLPDSVKVMSCRVVPDDFHARFFAKKKTYLYKFYISPHLRPNYRKTHYQINYDLDVDKMKAAANKLVGEHDFKGFMAAGSSVENTVRTIYSLTIKQDNEFFEIEVTGNGFLYNMVRIIVGTLLYVGCGKLTLDDIDSIIKTGNRKLAGITVPAHGLYLKSVEYEGLN